MSFNHAQKKFFADYIYKELGIVFAEHNWFQLEQRIEKVAKNNNFPTVLDLYEHCKKFGITGDLKQYILDTATNNETSFFRDNKIFDIFESDLVRGIANQFPGEKIKIWSAASSFGQEPYSIAILAYEYMLKSATHPRIEILATDISEQALARANQGLYTQLEIQRGMAIDRLIKYFDKVDENHWQINSKIKNLVQFKKQNLLSSFPYVEEFHIVFCRNVLIYQEDSRKIEIVDKIIRSLKPGGYLVFGASESGFGLSNKYEQVSFNGAIVYRKK